MNDVQGIIKIGKISSVNPKEAAARVTFEDRSDFTSYDMRIVFPFSSADKAYYMPIIDERVLCVFLPNDPTQGFILGSFYSENRKPPITDENKLHVSFSDGTTIEYNKKESEISVYCVGGAKIKVNGNAEINIEGSSSIRSEGEISLKSDSSIDMEAVGAVTIKSDASIKLAAPNVDM